MYACSGQRLTSGVFFNHSLSLSRNIFYFYFICMCIYTYVQVFLETRKRWQIDFRNPETGNTGICELPAIGSLSNSGSLRIPESSFLHLHLIFELDIN